MAKAKAKNNTKSKTVNKSTALSSAAAGGMLMYGASEFQDLSLGELVALREAINTHSTIISGQLSQPCFQSEDEDVDGLNVAGRMVEKMGLFLDHTELAILNYIQRYNCQNSREAEMRAWALIGFSADYPDSLLKHASSVAEYVHDYAAQLYRERSGRS